MKQNLLIGVIVALAPMLSMAQWNQLPGLTQNVKSVYKSNNNLMVGTTSGVQVSTDNGMTWNAASGNTVITKAFTKSGATIFAAGYEKLYSSTDDGVTWGPLSTIYTNQSVNNVLIKNGSYVVGMNGNGIWYSTNSGTTWANASSWAGSNSALVSKNNLLFASYSNNLQSSNNNGTSWITPNGNGIMINTSWQNISSLGVKNDSVLIAGTNNGGNFTSYDGVYFSLNNGDNWTKKVTGLTNTAIKHIAVAGNLIFVGTDGGGVFYSSDNGDNWNDLNTGLTDLTINHLYVNGSTLYAGVPTGLFRIEICNLLKNTSTLNSMGALAINAGDSVKLLANTSGTVYQLLKNNTALYSSANNVFYAKQSGNYRVVVEYSSTCKDTTNQISISVSTGIDQLNPAKNVMLVYPNPCKDQVIILAEDLNVNSSYSLIDQIGRVVLSGKLNTGSNHVDISELAPGLYAVIVNGEKVSGAGKIIKQ